MLGIVLEKTVPPEASDYELALRIARGEEDALRILYDLYARRLYSFAYRLTDNPALAEEAVQESLVAAWQGAHRFRRDGSLITWLLGIVHHKAVNLLRRPETDPIADAAVELPSMDSQPDTLAVRSEQHRLIRQGLDELSVDHRSVLELIFFQRLSLVEAAEVCNCPVGTIKSRLSYAKTYLRGVLSRSNLGVEELGE